MMRRFVLLAFLALFTGAALALPIFSGSISSDNNGGIYATGSWDDGGATLTYTVSKEDDDLWKYVYEFNVDRKDLSHIIFQVSDTFTAANVFGGSTSGWSLGEWGDEGNSNPGIPSSFYGIKFDGDFSLENTITLVSDRAPMWGDFYAKDGVDQGTDVYAYNSGFGDSITCCLFNGGKILVPDTLTTTTIPEPASLALLGGGLLGLSLVRRRKINL